MLFQPIEHILKSLHQHRAEKERYSKPQGVEQQHEPLPTRSYKTPSAVDIEIAKHVVSEIPNGAVLSLGVGGVPFTVAKMIADSDLKDLGCHTGTISDAFLELHRAGKLTNGRKEIDNGYSTCVARTG